MRQFSAIVGYTLRSCLPPKRLFGVVLAGGSALLLGLLARAVNRPADTAFAEVASEGFFGLAMPIAALIVGDAVLGAETRAGTFHFTWLSPVKTVPIVLGRWLAGSAVAAIAVAVPIAAAAHIAGAPDAAGPAAAAAATGVAAYIALFIAVGCITKRTAVWALAIVFLVERLLGAALSGIAQVSPQWEARAAFVGLLDDVPRRLERSGIPAGSDAMIRLAIIAVVCLAIADWRIRRLRLSGATD